MRKLKNEEHQKDENLRTWQSYEFIILLIFLVNLPSALLRKL